MHEDFKLTKMPAGYLRLEYRPGTQVDMGLIGRSLQAVDAAASGRYRLMVLPSGLRHMDTDARAHLAGLDDPIAVAIVISSMVDRIVANTFISLGTTKYPTHAFNDEHAAEEWLSRQS